MSNDTTTASAAAESRSAPSREDACGATGSPTRDMAEWLAGLRPDAVSPRALEWARHCLLDWCAVTVAGAREPLAAILRDELAPEGSVGAARLVASGRRAPVNDAALINGATSHALDFDDVHQRMHGHPTVAVAPALLALAEARGASGLETLTAFVAGLEIAGALGAMMGDAHYDHGFHATATVGSVASAAACSVLLGLDATRTARALALAGTQAAGLKSNFGTMAKPLHAGRAAQNGLLAARLASRGYTAREDGLECAQGFGPTLSSDWRPAPFRPDPSAPFEVESVLFKYHAACYLTHSTIEALRSLRAEVAPEEMASLAIHVPASHRKVCDIVDPKTGLDVKFSIRHLAGLALSGRDTADLGLYTDATAQDPAIAALRERVTIDPVEKVEGERHAAAITLRTRDGRELTARANVGIPASNLLAQQGKLEAKARAIAAPAIGEARTEAMIAAAAGLHEAPDLEALLDAIA